MSNESGLLINGSSYQNIEEQTGIIHNKRKQTIATSVKEESFFHENDNEEHATSNNNCSRNNINNEDTSKVGSILDDNNKNDDALDDHETPVTLRTKFASFLIRNLSNEQVKPKSTTSYSIKATASKRKLATPSSPISVVESQHPFDYANSKTPKTRNVGRKSIATTNFISDDDDNNNNNKMKRTKERKREVTLSEYLERDCNGTIDEDVREQHRKDDVNENFDVNQKNRMDENDCTEASSWSMYQSLVGSLAEEKVDEAQRRHRPLSFLSSRRKDLTSAVDSSVLSNDTDSNNSTIWKMICPYSSPLPCQRPVQNTRNNDNTSSSLSIISSSSSYFSANSSIIDSLADEKVKVITKEHAKIKNMLWL